MTTVRTLTPDKRRASALRSTVTLKVAMAGSGHLTTNTIHPGGASSSPYERVVNGSPNRPQLGLTAQRPERASGRAREP